MAGQIYLDNNATTQPHPEVVEVVAHHLYHSFANPGSRHAFGRTARKVLESSREKMAQILGANPDEIVFTSGGTESTNLAVFGACQGVPGSIALTAGEHPATTQACRNLELRGWALEKIAVNEQGQIRSDVLDNLPWNELKLACVILAHNETGVIQDISELSQRCRQHQVPLHLDVVQAAGKIDIDFHQSGASLMSIGAHKFHGPRGIGALLIRDGVRLGSYLFGGHQERERRPGTESVALIAGMVRALEIWHETRTEIEQQISALRDQLQQGLESQCSPCVVIGRDAHRLPNTLNIAFPGLDGEAMLVALELDGVACSLGSTCASGSSEPAPVLVAMGYPADVYRSAVRFSLGQTTTREEIDEALRRITNVIDRLRNSTDNAIKLST